MSEGGDGGGVGVAVRVAVKIGVKVIARGRRSATHARASTKAGASVFLLVVSLLLGRHQRRPRHHAAPDVAHRLGVDGLKAAPQRRRERLETQALRREQHLQGYVRVREDV